MGGQRRAFAAVALIVCALSLTACGSQGSAGVPCDLPTGARFEVREDGGYLVVFADGTVARLAFVKGACVFGDVNFVQPRLDWSDDELRFVYDYYRMSLTPCLDRHGSIVLAPPTRDSFVASGGNWSPYDSVWAGRLSGEEIATLAEVCPALPALPRPKE